MVVETNAYIGHWPLRQLKHNTATGLLELMDRKRIDKAIVSSTHSIFYRNCHRGNLELAEEIEGLEDRLIPFATLNPNYPGWKSDLKQCVEELGMKGLRLHPCYHDYGMGDGKCRELIDMATEYGLLVSVSIAMEDQRQRHWLIELSHATDSNVTNTQIINAIKGSPEATFILLTMGYSGFSGYDHKRILQETKPKEGKLFFAITNLRFTPDEEGAKQMREIGIERVVFASQIPFKYPEASFLRVESLPLTTEEKERIYSRNIVKLISQ
jgi:predicted TIM-barrel fold metal-dependent hydrolase